MRKVIHSNFELDLSSKKITDISENPIFFDKFSTKYSYPIEIDIEDDIDIAFGFISFFNSSNPLTYIDVMYVHDDLYSPAILEVEEIQGKKMQVTISWGFEEFPTWNKKLSELSLDNFEVTNIYQHAKTIIQQTFPAVNYNFPQIHTKKFDEDEDVFFFFEKIINNYKNGNFIENYVDTIEDIHYIKNLIQPLPYLVHVLQRGFADGNYTLSGNFIEHQLIKKIQLYSDVQYYEETEKYEEKFIQKRDELVFGPGEINNFTQMYNKIFIFPINKQGKFNIIGESNLFGSENGNINQRSFIRIRYKGLLIFEQAVNFDNNIINVETEFVTTNDSLPNEIEVQIYCSTSQAYTEERFNTVFDLLLSTIYLFDDNGDPIPKVINENKVDLTKVVPEMTFGELITQLKNWFNLNLIYEGNNAIMNFIETDINAAELKDFSMFEIIEPLRKIRKGFSYLLKFKDINSKEYNYLPVHHSVNGIVTENYKTDEKTSEIVINGYPLPVVNFNSITTAHAFEEVTDKLQLVIYDGLTNGLNLCKNADDLLLPNIHTAFWKKWFERRINSHSFQWTFIADSFELLNKSVKDKINCYSCNHLIRTISKTQIEPDIFEVEIETEAEI